MKLAALFSGGKDSTYCIYLAKRSGHEVVCLITMNPRSDESMLFHYPDTWIVKYLANAMEIPLLTKDAIGVSIDDESLELGLSIKEAMQIYNIEGIVHGGISSMFQKKAFQNLCQNNGIATFTPLWNRDPVEYMYELVKNRFEFVITRVSAMGLNLCWLGKLIDFQSLEKLLSLSKKFGFNISFEGGEAETLVVSCPLYHNKRLEITKSSVSWDNLSGILQISEARMVPV
jgi:ABC transporter with metal-binding/Fe-S-binding domain ATP-binding protein